jgi:hypothetical protein
MPDKSITCSRDLIACAGIAVCLTGSDSPSFKQEGRIMKLARTLAALTFAAAAPLSAFAATGNLVVAATNPSGCAYLVLGPTSTNFEEAKLFQAAILQAKAMRAYIQLNYNTAGCLISGFQVQPN